MSQAYYRKWRPRRWSQMVGQDHVVTTLHNAVTAGRVAHAYLFSGPRGTGKTTAARLLAKAVNCLDDDPSNRPCNACSNCQAVNEGRFLDLIEIDAASNTSVDDVRDLRDKINFSPNVGQYKVYIIDEVHMLSTAAFNALLKTLEEPPPHAIFILATTEVHKIPATVLSRCQRHEFRRVSLADILTQLNLIVEGEGLQIDQDALQLVARQATGSVRDAISLLDQLASTGQNVSLQQAQLVLGTATSQSVLDLVNSLLTGDPAQGLNLIQAVLDGGSDPRQFARQVVEYLRSALLVHLGSGGYVDETPEIIGRMAEHARLMGHPRLLELIRIFNRAASDTRSAWKPSMPLELAYLESLAVMVEIPETTPSKASTSLEIGRSGGVPSDSLSDRSDASQPDPASHPGSIDSDDPLSPQHIAKVWPDVLLLSRQRNPQTQGLLNSCKPLGVKNQTLLLGFSSELIKSKMEKPEHLSVAREVLGEVLGVEVDVRCIVSAATQGDKVKDLEGLDRDGIVAVAVRDLGGEIVDIQ